MATVTEIVLGDERGCELEDSEARRVLRCAIYTHKSGEEGLDWDRNSLQVQREAAEALIASRQAEGWTVVPERYDDGVYSGAERPALKRLLSDIEEGGIGCVVVYKLDRLSRSIVGFTRILQTLEAHGVGFVSVAQQFDTTRPLRGPLVNVLLGCAQLEREFMTQRAARGKWRVLERGGHAGGLSMLGYTTHPRDRHLVVNDEEAEQVRAIFGLYLERRSVRAVVEELNRRGWRAKRQVTKKGIELGGKPFEEQGVRWVLRHRVYIGETRVQGKFYPGRHEAIVDEEVWRRAQQLLKHNATAGGKRAQNKYGAVLRSVLYCDACDAPMRHSACGPTAGYRYYACVDQQWRIKRTCPTGSVPAAEVERRVVKHVRGLAADSHPVAEAVRQTREQCEARIRQLEEGRQAVLGELKRLDEAMCALLRAAASPGDKSAPQLSLLETNIPATEERMRAIRGQLVSSHRELVDARGVRRALAVFGPDWDSLDPLVRWDSVTLLIERVGYNGRTRELTVRFRPAVMPGVPDTRIRLGASGNGDSE
ncbi:MAG TPA: recombinase family protein [Planctomycetota bacterium]|nr:recombinase family protein [Planctomycetota bacterium]